MTLIGRAALALGVLLGAVAACGDDDSSSQTPDPSPANIYAAVIRWLLPEVPEGGEPDDRQIFVDSRGTGVTIDLDTQAKVVSALEKEATVRFVDEPDEALSGDEPDAPVRDDGVLIGIGAIPEGSPPFDVYADRWTRRDQIEGFRLTVAPLGEDWAVVAHSEVEPEVPVTTEEAD